MNTPNCPNCSERRGQAIAVYVCPCGKGVWLMRRGWFVPAGRHEPHDAHDAGPILAVAPKAGKVRSPHGKSARSGKTPNGKMVGLLLRAMPRIGDEGRWGEEKVFISAIWHMMNELGLKGWTLGAFKVWLLAMNERGELDLARADAKGDMDPTLVEESQIVNRGHEFHFVRDHGTGKQG